MQKKVNITSLSAEAGDQAGAGAEFELSEFLFGAPIRPDLVHRVIRWQLAKRQAGTHKTKSRGEVSGSTKKLYRQKGTGNARIGSARTPQRRHGGRAFGPVVRDHAHDLPKKVRKLGLRSALSDKAARDKLFVLDGTSIDVSKTRDLVKRFNALGWSSVLIIGGDTIDEGFARALRNIPQVDLLPQQGANVYDIVRRDLLVVTPDAVQALEARLK